jgi:hypothetical protein
MFIKFTNNKIFSGFSQTQQYITLMRVKCIFIKYNYVPTNTLKE